MPGVVLSSLFLPAPIQVVTWWRLPWGGGVRWQSSCDEVLQGIRHRSQLFFSSGKWRWVLSRWFNYRRKSTIEIRHYRS
jgi:hypothetical protein